jgi:hypothetical protein
VCLVPSIDRSPPPAPRAYSAAERARLDAIIYRRTRDREPDDPPRRKLVVPSELSEKRRRAARARWDRVAARDDDPEAPC